LYDYSQRLSQGFGVHSIKRQSAGLFFNLPAPRLGFHNHHCAWSTDKQLYTKLICVCQTAHLTEKSTLWTQTEPGLALTDIMPEDPGHPLTVSSKVLLAVDGPRGVPLGPHNCGKMSYLWPVKFFAAPSLFCFTAPASVLSEGITPPQQW